MLEIVQRGGFAAAARAREIDPSAVSRQVAHVEKTLGARLFHRTTRRLSLTEAGEAYLGRVAEALCLLEEAADEARQSQIRPSGVMKLTASAAFAEHQLAPLLPRFLEEHPDLELELLATDRVVDLVAERVDLAIRMGHEIEGDLICSKLRPTRYCVCASPDYVKAAQKLKDPKDLAKHNCVRFDFAPYRDRWRFRRGSRTPFEVRIDGRLTISSALGVRDAAIRGLGPALLADWLCDKEIESGRLVDLFPAYEATAANFDTAIWFAYPSRSYLPSKTRVAIEFFREHLGAR